MFFDANRFRKTPTEKALMRAIVEQTLEAYAPHHLSEDEQDCLRIELLDLVVEDPSLAMGLPWLSTRAR